MMRSKGWTTMQIGILTGVLVEGRDGMLYGVCVHMCRVV